MGPYSSKEKCNVVIASPSVDDKMLTTLGVKCSQMVSEFLVMQADHFFNLKIDIDVQRETRIQHIYTHGADGPPSQEEEALVTQLNEVSTQRIRQIEETEQAFQAHFKKELASLHTGTDMRKAFAKLKLSEYALKQNMYDSERDCLTLVPPQIFDRDHELGHLQNVMMCNEDLKQVQLLNLNSQLTIKILVGHTDRVSCMCLYDQHKLITGSWDHSIKVILFIFV